MKTLLNDVMNLKMDRGIKKGGKMAGKWKEILYFRQCYVIIKVKTATTTKLKCLLGNINLVCYKKKITAPIDINKFYEHFKQIGV